MRKNKKQTLGNKSFYYCRGFEISYNNYRPCENGSNCCDDYCRCGEIEDLKILSVGDISEYFGPQDEINSYCIDRILSINKVWDIQSWEARSCNGYYGEEIDGVYLLNGDSIENEVIECLFLDSLNKKIEHLLNLEYGYLLDALKDKTWEIKSIPKESIIFGQQDHYRRLDKNVVDSYKEYKLPRGICLEVDDKYRLIDGYHRLSACKDKMVKVICAKD